MEANRDTDGRAHRDLSGIEFTDCVNYANNNYYYEDWIEREFTLSVDDINALSFHYSQHMNWGTYYDVHNA